jgi:hypothetical protein
VASVGIAAITALDAYAAARLARAAGAALTSVEEAGITSVDVSPGGEPPDDLSKDPAYEPPEPLKGIKGG